MSLKVNFYCDEKYKGEVYEPIESSKLFPSWFADLQYNPKKRYSIINNNPYFLDITKDSVNLKNCPGITDFLKTGYIIRSWGEFVFRETDDESLHVNWVSTYYDKTNYIIHPQEQYETMPNKPIYGHFSKINTPWAIKTDKGVSCLITHPIWHNNKLFTTSTGVFHTDASPLSLPWFFEWNSKIKTGMSVDNIDIENQVIPKGEPIILIIPFYRKKYSHTINYISEMEMKNMTRSQENLTRDTVASKCPYTQFRKNLGKLF
jgi:hypothetical protein